MKSIWSRIAEAAAKLRGGAGAGAGGGRLSWLGSGGSARHRAGWRAEQFAASYLTGQGYHVLERNVEAGPGEIDIVAEHRRRLVFIEVRSRREGDRIRPSSTLTREKSARIFVCADAYMRSRGLSISEVRPRYDVAEVYLDEQSRPRRVVVLEAAVSDPSRR